MEEKSIKQRVIQEYVPGKQVTLAHLISKPRPDIFTKLGLDNNGKDSIGVLTITPSEASIIAADAATKKCNIELGFLDRFTGTVVLTGKVSEVETALLEVLSVLNTVLGYDISPITRS